MSKIKCNICGSDYSEEYFRDIYSGYVICEACLLEIDGITTETVSSYFLEGEYIGSSNNIGGVLENICDNTSYEKVTGGLE